MSQSVPVTWKSPSLSWLRVPSFAVSSRNRWLVVWIFALLPLLGWWLYGLFDVDEGFYGAVTAEMNRRGEWITPFYNGRPWFEKPILLYWLAKPCLMLFGQTVGARLPSVLTALATYGVIAWFAKRRISENAGQLAAMMLASSLLVVGTGRMMMTDLPLVACLTAAMITFWESLVDKPVWRVWTAGFLGFGVLAKGPVALILFSIIAGWTFWREPELRVEFRKFWLQGIAVMCVVIGAWYVPAYMQNGQLFVQKFLVEQNIGRFTGGDAAHTLPGISGLVAGAGMYIGVLLLGMFPWSLFIWKAWPRRLRVAAEPTTSGSDEALKRYLATWAAVVFIFFTISGAKLVHYLLPMMPPLAILIAVYASGAGKSIKRWLVAAATSCVAMSLLANCVFIFWYKASGQAEVHALCRYVKKEGGAVAIYQMGRRNKDLGTGKPKLQETSLPSLLMVLDQTAIDTDSLDEILRAPTPIWIITRENRIKPADFIVAQKAGRQLGEVKPPLPEDAFKLYLVRSTLETK